MRLSVVDEGRHSVPAGRYDLSLQAWRLSGWGPDVWRLVRSLELGGSASPEIAPIPCRVPGSVQQALLEAGLLPDWNVGLNARACEWVENRHWIYETELPEVPSGTGARLRFRCLDGPAEIWLDDECLGSHKNSFVPIEIDLGDRLAREDCRRHLRVAFVLPPRWLGQVGYTSQIRDWKPRFNYTWDWVSRLVQIGIAGEVALETGDPDPLRAVSVTTTYDPASSFGGLRLTGVKQPLVIRLSSGERVIREMAVAPSDQPIHIDFGKVDRWEPNGSGPQTLYTLDLECGSHARQVHVGFRHIVWHACEGAHPSADPWICVINGRPTFLQGINWTPIRPNFAELCREDYAKRLCLYRDIGFNCIRVWGGGFAEHDWLYELCDELGLLVWQDFPLSSSGIDNWPPEDPEVMNGACGIARDYLHRLPSHPSVFVWCGGNELQGGVDGNKVGCGKPCDNTHPLLSSFATMVKEFDPGNRFVPSSSSGPRFMASASDFGKNLHWDVHGPWIVDQVDCEPWQMYWENDDALFRSEMGHPGAQSASLTRRYLGECDYHWADISNPYWHRWRWWFNLDAFIADRGKEAWEIEDHVAWSQARQAEFLAHAVTSTRARFPRCGGFLLWMGHDSFPCASNTSIIDFDGEPKPVCAALARVLSDPTLVYDGRGDVSVPVSESLGRGHHKKGEAAMAAASRS